MQKDSLNNTLLLCLLRHCHQHIIGVVIIFLTIVLEPISLLLNVIGTLVLIEEVDRCSTDSYINNTYLYTLRQILHHRTTKVIGRSQSCTITTEWRISRIPLSLLSIGRRHINSSHHHKTGVNKLAVCCLDSCITFHIRLSKAQIDVKIRVKSLWLFYLTAIHYLCLGVSSALKKIDALSKPLNRLGHICIRSHLFWSIRHECSLQRCIERM